MSLFKCNAVNNDFRAVYDFEYTKDSINSIKGKDILYLEISEKGSFCFSYYSYQSDSLKNEPNGKAIWRELFSAAIAKDGINATSFPHQRSTFKISKLNKSEAIRIKDVIDNILFEYEIQKKDFNWQICDSTKIINGYESYRATCNYHGREWTVWFSPAIPFNDGPWVFCGLPGLIIEAKDKDNLYSFNLIEFIPNKELKKDWTGKGKKTDRITFLKKQHQYLKNLNSIVNAEMGTNIPYIEDTRYLDGLEPDFKQ